MGKFVEIMDQGARMVVRFHSNCPQTGRKYYHPPPVSDGRQSHGGASVGGGAGDKAAFSVRSHLSTICPLEHWHQYAAIVQSIKDLIVRSWCIRLSHTLREGNACADCLAKIGATSGTSWVVLDHLPSGLSNSLLADACRVSFPRL